MQSGSPESVHSQLESVSASKGALPIKWGTKHSLLVNEPASQSPQHGSEDSWKDEGGSHGCPCPKHPHSPACNLGDIPTPLDNQRSARLHGQHRDSPRYDVSFRTRDVDLRKITGSDHSPHWDDNRVIRRHSGRELSHDEHRNGDERLGGKSSRELSKFWEGGPDDGESPFSHTDQDYRVLASSRDKDDRGMDHDVWNSKGHPSGDRDYRGQGRGLPGHDSHRGSPPDNRRDYSRDTDYRGKDSGYGVMHHDYEESDYHSVSRADSDYREDNPERRDPSLADHGSSGPPPPKGGSQVPPFPNQGSPSPPPSVHGSRGRLDGPLSGGGPLFRGGSGGPPPPPGMHVPRKGDLPREGPPRGGGEYRDRGGHPRGEKRG